MEYVDSCITLEVLNQDSGLLPPPREGWHTFAPEKGDIAHVDEENADYEFNGSEWVKIEEGE